MQEPPASQFSQGQNLLGAIGKGQGEAEAQSLRGYQAAHHRKRQSNMGLKGV